MPAATMVQKLLTTGAPPKTSGITKTGFPPKLKAMMMPGMVAPGETTTLTILQNVTVLAVGANVGTNSATGMSYDTVTVHVTPEEAELLVFARDRAQPDGVREAAIFWLGVAAGDKAASELEAIVDDESEDGTAEAARAVARLQRRGLAIYSGFTPSDAAHVLGHCRHFLRREDPGRLRSENRIMHDM